MRLGVNSVIAPKGAVRLSEAFQIELPLRRLFEAPTVGQLAGVVRELREGGEEREERAGIERAARGGGGGVRRGVAGGGAAVVVRAAAAVVFGAVAAGERGVQHTAGIAFGRGVGRGGPGRGVRGTEEGGA